MEELDKTLMKCAGAVILICFAGCMLLLSGCARVRLRHAGED